MKIKLGLVLMAFLVGLFPPKDAGGFRAIRIDCDSYFIIVGSRTGSPSLALAHELAEFLGPHESQICTTGSVIVTSREDKK